MAVHISEGIFHSRRKCNYSINCIIKKVPTYSYGHFYESPYDEMSLGIGDDLAFWPQTQLRDARNISTYDHTTLPEANPGPIF